jgi:hypothetical protein
MAQDQAGEVPNPREPGLETDHRLRVKHVRLRLAKDFPPQGTVREVPAATTEAVFEQTSLPDESQLARVEDSLHLAEGAGQERASTPAGTGDVEHAHPRWRMTDCLLCQESPSHEQMIAGLRAGFAGREISLVAMGHLAYAGLLWPVLGDQHSIADFGPPGRLPLGFRLHKKDF